MPSRDVTIIRRLADRGRSGLRGTLEAIRFPGTSDARRHHVRLVMNKHIDSLIADLPAEKCAAFEISGTNHSHRPWRSYQSMTYPQFDVCGEPPCGHAGRYDFVVTEQVLEHVPEPLAALTTMRRLCRPGGTVLVTTPFLIRIHKEPHDFWRFTPEGIAYLMEKAGLQTVDVQSWGNKDAVRGALYSWPKRRPWHSLRNEPDLPVVVWAVGKAPFDERTTLKATAVPLE